MKKTKQKNILWVEDDQQLVDLYTVMFTKIKDIKVEFLMLGQLALDRVKEIEEGKAEKPDLMMLDLLLPDVNGDRILEQLRKTPSTKDVPVFILTNYGGEIMEVKMTKELNAEKYLVKTEWVPTKLVPLILERMK
ncbi:MAG: hypothetical protein A2908_02220 [Candidatus Staskawiczbacteria bacterium RIFCSPLOWO2_01_FULL_38_12b]|uniref:Response regulatory domain-containing protein n=1 Tax=Candidatus Staskawiczbacteria bacterium RIFCSPLOWO2_01_FULL_38_12b TaxID=1802214 RepID=A0A1G2IGE5_9BACT|nr:MAG: hypothetical protein A2908_02220 [Candidatus Staskawiczbacteria bacterium RIFCSPLOWO2_01_FULL_38_12b]